MANWLVYYGNGYTAQMWTREQRSHNVDIIASYFTNKGWTVNAIAAMVGNMEGESYINPGQWQHGYAVEDPSVLCGFGLVQWTPWTKFTDWAGGWYGNYYCDKQLDRIQYELENGLQWDSNRPNHPYPESFEDFSVSTKSVDYLAECFFWCYEYGTWDNSRITNAEYWYNYLTNNPPGPTPPHPSYESKPLNIMFYLKPKWKRGKYNGNKNKR